MRLRCMSYVLFGLAAILCFSRPTFAQDMIPAGKVTHALRLYEKFEGSAASGADVFDMNTSIGYDFNRIFGVETGVPVYFVTPAPSAKLLSSQSNGIGDMYIDFRFALSNALFDFTSTPSFAFPTGDTSKGFSTGHVGFTWDNEMAHSIGRFTPYLSIAPGNGLNNISNPHTRVVHRNFITLGKEAEFTAGSDVDLFGPFSVNLDAYDVVPWGRQEVLSRIVKKGTVTVNGVKHNRYYAVNSVTTGGANLAKDNGYDAALDAALGHFVLVEVGYDYSVRYAEGTAFFSIGFDLSRLISRGLTR